MKISNERLQRKIQCNRLGRCYRALITGRFPPTHYLLGLFPITRTQRFVDFYATDSTIYPD
jgi:hypothetical protein